MRIRNTLLSLAALNAVAVPCAADTIPPPYIREETLLEYLENDHAQWKLMEGIYAESLREEADSLADEIFDHLQAAPETADAFLAAHEAFFAFAETQARYCEEVQWRDLGTGESSWGSGYGETALAVLCSLYWNRVLYYREVLHSVAQGGFTDAVFETLPFSEIGGR